MLSYAKSGQYGFDLLNRTNLVDNLRFLAVMSDVISDVKPDVLLDILLDVMSDVI